MFLETGSSSAGIKHIIAAHGDDFARIGIPLEAIPDVVMHAVTKGAIVGYQGKGFGRPIYEIMIDGKRQRVAVTTSDNGFVVGANPAGGVG